MIEIKNGSIVELDKDNSYKYVVMGYHSNGITVMPLENYKNKIFKDFKYILFFFLAKVKVIDKIKDYCKERGYEILTIDGVKVKYPDGFALVRASNTGPNITMRFEATTEKRLEELQREFTEVVNKYL